MRVQILVYSEPAISCGTSRAVGQGVIKCGRVGALVLSAFPLVDREQGRGSQKYRSKLARQSLCGMVPAARRPHRSKLRRAHHPQPHIYRGLLVHPSQRKRTRATARNAARPGRRSFSFSLSFLLCSSVSR